MAVVVGTTVLAGLVGQRLDRVLALAKHGTATSRRLCFHKLSAATFLGVFGLATGVLNASLATGLSCGRYAFVYAEIPTCQSLLESPIVFRVEMTAAAVIGHWWVGTRIGSMIDMRQRP